MMEGVNLIKTHICKFICKCHNESLIQLIYANKNKKEEPFLDVIESFKWSSRP
jgi:hypothetical protein